MNEQDHNDVQRPGHSAERATYPCTPADQWLAYKVGILPVMEQDWASS